jgi:threonine dehydrogenase-like Zn-dependent dehydrogenase
MAAEMAEIHPGSTVAIFGCGPVAQFAIASAKLLDAGRIFAIDNIPSRLVMARQQGAEIINFDEEDPVQAIQGFTAGIGADRVIDCVGVDANRPHRLTHALKTRVRSEQARPERGNGGDGNWRPGDSPAQVFEWAIKAIAKAGNLSIVGVYGDTARTFPIGQAMEKNLTIRMGNCNHRKYIPKLLTIVRNGSIDVTEVLTQLEPMSDVIEAYKRFDRRSPGWIKVMLQPQPDRQRTEAERQLV